MRSWAWRQKRAASAGDHRVQKIEASKFPTFSANDVLLVESHDVSKLRRLPIPT
jgi:hypothetical protein